MFWKCPCTVLSVVTWIHCFSSWTGRKTWNTQPASPRGECWIAHIDTVTWLITYFSVLTQRYQIHSVQFNDDPPVIKDPEAEGKKRANEPGIRIVFNEERGYCVESRKPALLVPLRDVRRVYRRVSVQTLRNQIIDIGFCLKDYVQVRYTLTLLFWHIPQSILSERANWHNNTCNREVWGF